MSAPSSEDEKENFHSNKLYKDHEIVKISDSKFSSLPLFLPANYTYDPETNTVSPIDGDGENKSDEHNNSNQQRLVKVPNAGWDMLQALNNEPLSVISCVGPYRTGKSLLMSRFLQSSNAFEIGPTLDGCTRGIWISTSALKATNGCYKLMLDVEGLGDPLVGDDASNARIALTCLLLSNVFVFNTTSHPDRNSLQFLKCLATIRQRLPTDKQHRPAHPPAFLWVFRDFFLQLPVRRDTDPPQPYTLQEYMLERVLMANNNNNSTGAVRNADPSTEGQVVDSLLSDFSTLEIQSVGYPKKSHGQHPLGPEEMAHLDQLEWKELDEGFRADIQTIIERSLDLATPFQMGSSESTTTKDKKQNKKSWNPFRSSNNSKNQGEQQQHKDMIPYATGKAYSKWCETVLELVNSSGAIPNIPDLQEQLLLRMADESLTHCIRVFEEELTSYLEACPIFNHPSDKNGNTTTNAASLKPVAETPELHQKAQELYRQQQEKLYQSNITSTKILNDALEQLEARCIANANHQNIDDDDDDSIIDATSPHQNRRSHGDITAWRAPSSSIYSTICSENVERSRTSCQHLAMDLYGSVQSNVRQDPTSMTLKEFHDLVGQLKNSYQLQARGPAKNQILQSHLLQPSEADALFIAKVTEKNDELQESLEFQASLRKDVQAKEAALDTLQQDLENVKLQTQQELEALRVTHESNLRKLLEEQKERERQEKEQLKADMESKLHLAKEEAEKERQEHAAQSKHMQKEAERRLEAEVQAREERLRQEQKAFDEEIQSLKLAANEELKTKLNLAENKRQEEQERIQKEMQQKLHDAETKLQKELADRQKELLTAKEDLEAKEKLEQELRDRLEAAEANPCENICCCM